MNENQALCYLDLTDQVNFGTANHFPFSDKVATKSIGFSRSAEEVSKTQFF